MAQIIRAEHLGFCFGVRDAILEAQTAAAPERTSIYGELVHNTDVTEPLRELNFELLSETSRDTIPERPVVMVTAHGISEKRRSTLIDSGKELIDTTCPLVRRVHESALMLAKRDYFVVVIGNPDHVEVLGVVEDLSEGGYAIISNAPAARHYGADRIGIVCQTTMPEEVASDCREMIARRNPQASIRFVNTICRPTRQRQAAVDQLCEQVEVVIVVGGTNSNNTRRLVERCQLHGRTAYHVQSAKDLQADWLIGHNRIGLTAGTSTPDETITAVEDRLLELTKPPSRRMFRGRVWCDSWSNRQWIDYFLSNRDDDPHIPWSQTPTLGNDERTAIKKSVQIFQLGESGEGRNIRRCARDWIDRGGDADYLDALQLFLEEENQHAAWLERFLHQEEVKTLEKQWSDGCFRFLRHLMGLRTSIAVLVTAEILAQVYYLALLRATESPTLRAICQRILRDERAHVTFQQNQVKHLTEHWGPLQRFIIGGLERMLFEIAVRIVWYEHNEVFVLAKMNWSEFRDRSRRRWHGARKESRRTVN